MHAVPFADIYLSIYRCLACACPLLTAYAKRESSQGAQRRQRIHSHTSECFVQNTFSCRAREIERFRQQSWPCFTRKSARRSRCTELPLWASDHYTHYMWTHCMHALIVVVQVGKIINHRFVRTYDLQTGVI